MIFYKETNMKLKSIFIGTVVALSATTHIWAQGEPGLTKDTIKIGIFAPLSGPASSYGVDPVNGAKMYYDKINKEGGINGRKIELVIKDDRCSANDLVTAVKELVESDKVFLLHGGSCSAQTMAAVEYVQRSKIPFVVLAASGDGLVYPVSRYIYGAFSMTQHASGASMVEFSTQYLKAKKIAYVNHDDIYGTWNFEGADFTVQKAGAALSVQSINPAITDVTAPILKLKASNADVLVLAAYPRPMALLIKKAHELGLNKPIVLGVAGVGDLKALAENVGNKDALKNVYVQEMITVKGNPKSQWVLDLYKAAYPDLAAQPGRPTDFMPLGTQSAMAVVKALQNAGPSLTRENFLSAMEKLDMDTGIMAGPIKFSATNHAANDTAVYLKWDGATSDKVPGAYKSLWKYQPK